MKSIFTFLFIAQLLCFASSSFLRNKKKQDTNIETADAPAKNDAGQVETESSPVTTKTAILPQEVKGEEEEIHDAFCFLNNNGTVYDLNDLSNDEADYRVKTITGFIDFNMCRNALNPCNDKSGMVSYTSSLQGDKCVQIAGNSTISSKFFIVEDKAANLTVLRMKMPEGDVCNSDTTKRYQTTVDFYCDEEAEEPVISNSPININTCSNKLYVTSKAACPKYDVYALWNRIQDNKWVFGFIIIGLGIFFCFFGENFIKIAQVIAGGALVLLVFMYLIFANTSMQLYSWQFWVILIVALALGFVGGWFMSKLDWLPGVVFGALLGFVLGFFVYNLMLRFIESNPAVVFWITLSLCVIGGVLMGFFFNEEIAIISTAVVGAYGIIRGLSIIAGGFPDERQVYELGSKGEWDQMHDFLTGVVYAYLAGFLVLAAVGMYIQFKFFYDGDKKKKDGEEKKDEDKEGKEPLKEES